MSGAVGYNPNDPVQNAFLAALAQGETGGSTNPYATGVGGTDLSSLIQQGDTIAGSGGFPAWSGSGNSHAAGAYQFEPGTWEALASQYGLNFSDPTDQNAGAWYLAQSTYAQDNNGASLEQALANGNIGNVSSSLANIWPSTQNASFSSSLTNDLASGNYSATNIAPGSASIGVVGNGLPALPAGESYGSTNTDGSVQILNSSGAVVGSAIGMNNTYYHANTPASSSSSSGTGGSILGSILSATGISGIFIRAMVILVGVVILAIALWALLKDTTVGKVAKSAAADAVI